MAKKVASNEDLLREILVRLPVKPLLRFKCVSKRWLALISEPRFCHSHTLRHYKHSSRPFASALLLATGSGTPSPFRCPIFPLNGSSSDSDSSSSSSSSSSSNNFRYVKIPRMMITLMLSSNGLLLVEGRPIKNPNNPLKARHFVYNPTTNQHVAVNFPTPQFRSSVLSLFLCFEPLKSPHYKIVSLRFKDISSFSAMMNYAAATTSRNANAHYVVNVYSSETGSWSENGVNFTAPFPSIAVYCNGAIYWSFPNAVKSKYFDVENQCFKKYPMPPPKMRKDKTLKYFGESGGHLHVVAQSILDFEVDVLELNEDRSGWSVRFHLKLDSMLAAFPRLRLQDFGLIDVFCVVRQGNEVDSMLVFSINGRFIGCTLLDHTIRKLSNFNPFLSAGAKLDVFHYYENLSSVAPSNF